MPTRDVREEVGRNRPAPRLRALFAEQGSDESSEHPVECTDRGA